MTVLDTRTQQRQAAQTAVTAAQSALGTASSALAAAQATLATATDALATLQKDQADIEVKISQAALPADLHQLDLDLESNLLQQQPARASLLDAREAVATQSTAAQRASAALDRAKADLAAADTALNAATADAASVTAWKAALGSQAFTDAKSSAASQTTTDLVNAALAKLDTWLGGPDLRALVRSRWDDATSRSDELADDIDGRTAAQNALLTVATPTAGALEAARAAADVARAKARVAAEGAVSQLAWALANLGDVVADKGKPTVAEQQRIDDRATAATDPAKRATAVNEAAVAHRHAAAVLDELRMVAIAKDPHFDPGDHSLQQQIDDEHNSATTLTTAEGSVQPTDSTVIAAWEVAVPASLWTLAASVFRADDIRQSLTSLLPTGPGSIVAALDAADDALAVAIQADADLASRGRAAADALADANDARAVLAATADQHRIASLRGEAVGGPR